MRFQRTTVIEKVEAVYSGFGATRKLKGATITATFRQIETDEDGVETEVEFRFTLDVPKSAEGYPTVGDSIEIAITGGING